MDKPEPLKSASADYEKTPFYLIQANGSNRRYVISFAEKAPLRDFLLGFIDRSQDIQVKILDNDEEPLVYAGEPSKKVLSEAIDQFEGAVFHDGYNELMVRRPETGDYIVLDEHALVFLYTHDDYAQLLAGYDLPHKPDEQLIYEVSHWHIRPANGSAQLQELIRTLGLTATS